MPHKPSRNALFKFGSKLMVSLPGCCLAWWPAGSRENLRAAAAFGCVTDIILGLIGSYLGGWIFTKLGIFGGGFLYSLAAATLGAVILVAIAHAFSPSDR